ncbi:transcriptional regulator, LysR family [Limimaricola cinnabarinus LL-001]|uniref:Transcriptional regulator, LysR family n=2 Tax=Limimaricola cinnabarinus TaxID=1125964 RepID=U2Z4G4_9RHOB|nr:transcriptional regulator, LysR family [Limimaricola cinnabarinus LL-001]
MITTMSNTAAKAIGRLTLRGLRAFIALEETRSVAAAAQKLGVSKSNVSQQITALEQSVGTKLFDRDKRPILLTPAGQVLSLHAHRITATVSAAEASLAEINLRSLPILNTGIIDDLDASLTPALASFLQARLPQCFISAFSGRSDQITEKLISRDIDIAVTAIMPTDMHRFNILPLLREQFVLISAQGKYDPRSDWRKTLSEIPLAQYSENMPMGRLVSGHLKRIGFHVQRRFSFESTRSVIATVVQTGGWTLSTPLSILDAGALADRVDISPLPFAGLSRQIYLITRVDEIGALPDLMARECRGLLRDRLLPEFAKRAPRLTEALSLQGQVEDACEPGGAA